MCHITGVIVEQATGEVLQLPIIGKKRCIKQKNKSQKKKKLVAKNISLIQASRTGNIAAVQQNLNQETVDINEQVVGCTALHYACFYNHIKVVQLLVENNANIDIQNTSGLTPFSWSVEIGNREIVEYLLDKCDPSIPDNFGFTPLHKAVSSGNLELVKLLLSCNTETEIWVNIDDTTKEENYTALHIAISKGFIDIAKFLIDSHANIELQSRSGATPLHFAVTKDQFEVAEYLLRSRACLDSTDYNDRTPLHYTCIYNRIQIAELLLLRGAKQDLKDVNSATPLNLTQSLSFHSLFVRYQNQVNPVFVKVEH